MSDVTFEAFGMVETCTEVRIGWGAATEGAREEALLVELGGLGDWTTWKIAQVVLKRIYVTKMINIMT